MFSFARKMGPSFISEATARLITPLSQRYIGRYAWSVPTSQRKASRRTREAQAASLSPRVILAIIHSFWYVIYMQRAGRKTRVLLSERYGNIISFHALFYFFEARNSFIFLIRASASVP